MGAFVTKLMQSVITFNYDDDTLVMTTVDFITDDHHIDVTIKEGSTRWDHTQEPQTTASVPITETFTLSRDAEGEVVTGDVDISVSARS